MLILCVVLGDGVCALRPWCACWLYSYVLLMGGVPHCGPPRRLEEGEWWAMAVGVAIALVEELL